MMSYHISPAVMYYLHTSTDFRRCAENTANETIGWVHDPAINNHECNGRYYMTNHNYTNRYYALDCEYSESIDRAPYNEAILRLF